MTNTTEMPEKIWVEPIESGKVRGQWTKSLWTDRDVPYTRTDTIPSRAAVVREFMGETNWRYKDDESFMSWHGAAIQILKEWEDGESKTNSI